MNEQFISEQIANNNREKAEEASQVERRVMPKMLDKAMSFLTDEQCVEVLECGDIENNTVPISDEFLERMRKVLA